MRNIHASPTIKPATRRRLVVLIVGTSCLIEAIKNSPLEARFAYTERGEKGLRPSHRASPRFTYRNGPASLFGDFCQQNDNPQMEKHRSGKPPIEECRPDAILPITIGAHRARPSLCGNQPNGHTQPHKRAQRRTLKLRLHRCITQLTKYPGLL